MHYNQVDIILIQIYQIIKVNIELSITFLFLIIIKTYFSESSNPSNGVPTFTEFMKSTNMFLNRLDKKLDVLLEHIKNPPSAQYGPLYNSILNMFPLKDVAGIIDMEENLKNDEYKLKIVRLVKFNFNFVLYTNIMLIFFRLILYIQLVEQA